MLNDATRVDALPSMTITADIIPDHPENRVKLTIELSVTERAQSWDMNTFLSCSVLNIKRVVKREIKINQDYVCLHYQDREVKDHLTLEDLGMQPGHSYNL